MRVLALDVGEKRIGVALGDPTGLIASPLVTIDRVGDPDDVEAVLDLAAEHGVEEIVVGIPISLSGREGPQAKRVARFKRSLAARATVPVTPLDERYSTVQAEKLMREAGMQPSRERDRVDAAAAAVVLQSYLDSRRLADQGGKAGQGRAG